MRENADCSGVRSAWAEEVERTLQSLRNLAMEGGGEKMAAETDKANYHNLMIRSLVLQLALITCSLSILLYIS